RYFGIGKVLAYAVFFLIILVPLAGDEHDVAHSRLGDRRAYRSCTIDLDAVAAIARRAHTLHDRMHDHGWIFGARIVAGDGHAAGERGGDRPHLGPLALVAVAAAAEHADELTARRNRRLEREQCFLQRIGRMRVIDDHERLIVVTQTLH